MATPVGVHAAPWPMPPRRLPVAAQRALWDLTWQRLLAPVATTDFAGPSRPLGAGDQPDMNNGSASRPRDCAAVAEDSHRVQHTSAADSSV
jgi:hypothetical protein